MRAAKRVEVRLGSDTARTTTVRAYSTAGAQRHNGGAGFNRRRTAASPFVIGPLRTIRCERIPARPPPAGKEARPAAPNTPIAMARRTPTPEPHAVTVTAGVAALVGFLAGAAAGAAIGSRWGTTAGLTLFFLVGFVGQRIGALIGRLAACAFRRLFVR